MRNWPDPLWLNLGSGKKKKPGYVNVDLPSKRSDCPLDVVKDDWPWEENTVDRIESYHFLEHLTEDGGLRVMRRSFHVLKPGGIFIAETPDLEEICARYPTRRRHGRWNIFGKPAWGEGMGHLWGYCADTFRLNLSQIGFTMIVTGIGTDYHQTEGICPSVRVEAMK